jgi:hypothetical protein
MLYLGVHGTISQTPPFLCPVHLSNDACGALLIPRLLAATIRRIATKTERLFGNVIGV